MTLLGFLIVLIIIGAGLYLLRLLPIDPFVKQIIFVVAFVLLAIYVISFLGTLAGMGTGMPRLR